MTSWRWNRLLRRDKEFPVPELEFSLFNPLEKYIIFLAQIAANPIALLLWVWRQNKIEIWLIKHYIQRRGWYIEWTRICVRAVFCELSLISIHIVKLGRYAYYLLNKVWVCEEERHSACDLQVHDLCCQHFSPIANHLWSCICATQASAEGYSREDPPGWKSSIELPAEPGRIPCQWIHSAFPPKPGRHRSVSTNQPTGQPWGFAGWSL